MSDDRFVHELALDCEALIARISAMTTFAEEQVEQRVHLVTRNAMLELEVADLRKQLDVLRQSRSVRVAAFVRRHLPLRKSPR